MQIGNLDDFHKDILSTLSNLKATIGQKFDQIFNKNELLQIQEKGDKSLVTNIDLFISDLFKQAFSQYKDLNFYSEEDQDSWGFPVLVLDPIDGTRELSQGVGECSVSFGIYFSEDFNDERNISWIYNPFTGFEINSLDHTHNMNRVENKTLLSFVSRTEYNKGLYENEKDFVILPKGSIAYKLGLLAAGSGDFVITKKPKNIWDIAAGTHICMQRGISLYQNGKKLDRIQKDTYANNLIWVCDLNKNRILTSFKTST
jgi:myo-inositol-1(or 4)-monophosphatase